MRATVSAAAREPALVEAVYPLAPEQEGLWYLHQLAPDCGAYHLLFNAQVEISDGGVPTAVTRVLTDLLARHEVLRTALTPSADGPQQWVYSHVEPDVRIEDAHGWTDELLAERARTDSRMPFDLARPPLWRVHLYRRGAARWMIAVVVHHVMLDFWSLGLLLKEVACRLGMAEPPDRIQADGYGAYASRRQSELAEGQPLERSLAYWREALHGAPPVHALPLDCPRPPSQDYDGCTLPFALDAAASEAIHRVARDEGATPFMVLFAVYCVVLARFSGEDDLVVAIPVAGRSDRSLRTQLGNFMNTLPLRVSIDESLDFRALLKATRDVVLGALRHQDCPFARIVETLAPRRDASHAPIAQLGFSWERLPLLEEFEQFFIAEPGTIEKALSGLTLRPFSIRQQEGQLDLTVEMGGEVEGRLVGVIKYRHRLFQASMIQEMADCFIRVTRQVTSEPGRPLSGIRLDDPSSHARWIEMGRGPRRDWSSVQEDSMPFSGLMADLAARAAATPQAVAVRDGTRTLDYAQLWQRAGRIAFALSVRGVTAESRVGIMLDRHADLLAGMLGIWLAGAAYVPLDPAFPRDRLGYIAHDAQISLLLTERAHYALWPADVPVLCVDEALPAQVLARPAFGETAYVLYTSGTTGLPKGVRVGHRSVRNFLLGMQEILHWDAQTRLLAVTTLSFDISVLELLLPLLAGGEVVIADHDSIRDGNRLAALLQDANAMQATPATWKMLIDAGWSGRPELTALCGGEALPPMLAEQLHARTNVLWNVYGPTETTVWSTAARLEPGTPIHLGAPIANTQLYVLDRRGYPVPPGVLGELWIGGDGLAIDYWNRPELTAERFRTLATLPDCGRLYRTGDRVRWAADGKLEHHQRLDFQVKLRGFRIEPSEIESVLRTCEGVRDAVAVVREDQPGDRRLVAYLVAPAGPAPDVRKLREALRCRLPEYMMPSAFVFLDAFPQTPNGKLDRKALPRPDHSLAQAAFIAPRDALEIQLAGLFGELLGEERIGVEDSFFELGGHSLLAVRLTARITQLTGIELPVAELVQHPTVSALAARLRMSGEMGNSILLTLRGGEGMQPLWLFHPIGGTVFCYLELTRRLAQDRPVLAIQSPGLDEADEAEVTLEAMASRYVEILREKQPHGPYLLGGWCFGGNVAFEVARQLHRLGEPIERIVLIDTRAPLPANVPGDADDATLLSWFARDLAVPYGKALHVAPETLRALPPEDMFPNVLDAAKAIGVLPEDADVDQLSRYLEVYMGNGIALRMYAPAPEDVPVLLIRAADEDEQYGPTLGWHELVENVQVVDVAGTHNSIMYAPQAAAVAAIIDRLHPVLPTRGFST